MGSDAQMMRPQTTPNYIRSRMKLLDGTFGQGAARAASIDICALTEQVRCKGSVLSRCLTHELSWVNHAGRSLPVVGAVSPGDVNYACVLTVIR